MDKEYWNCFYKKAQLPDSPSGFARYVGKDIKEGSRLLDLGCGNGRDSLYFWEQNAEVTAVDASEVAIEKLQKSYGGMEGIRFIAGDFIDETERFQVHFDYLYSRFSIHAINYEDQRRLLKAGYQSLKEGGTLYIEARSIHDEIFGLGEQVGRNEYIYDNHYRRFLVKEELEKELREVGYQILFSEEARGFAPFGESDPPVIRMIARKEQEKRKI